ncbi:MAG: hypothetical protein QM820_11535 [Minicystis sp.]
MDSPLLSRRSVLVGATTLLVLDPLTGCAGDVALRTAPWTGPPPGVDDVRLRALAWATLAPNAHNTQPWQLDLRRPGEVDLYVDRTRLLPETDPPARQIHLSQGTFLELLDLAARELGHTAEITLFPAGEYGPEEILDRPVATARFVPRPAPKDPLFAQVTRRLTNRRVYDDPLRALGPAQIEALRGAANAEQASFRVIDGAAIKATLAGMLGEAMAIESASRARNLETARWFHFSDADTQRRRDGFGLLHAGKSGFTRWFLETFVLDRETAGDPRKAFAAGAADQASAQAASASAFGLLTSRGNTRRAQVLAGRAYARVALTAAALDVAVHPMSQILEEYDDMRALTGRFQAACGIGAEETAQLIVRLGFAPPHDHTPRREVAAMRRG